MVLLARLAPVVGTGQALLVTSTLFGIGHWFGHPSGASGVLMAGFAGYVWGRSVLDTRGFFWAWLYEQTRSIWAAWLSHLLIDAGILLIGYDLLYG